MWLKRHLFLILLGAPYLLGCGGEAILDTDPPIPVSDPSYPQGIVGKVIKYDGNFFPSPDSDGEIYPIDARIFVCAGYVEQWDSVNPAEIFPVATVESTADEGYRVGLLSGVYTVFAEIDGKPYRNCHKGHPTEPANAFCFTEVPERDYIMVEIEDTTDASF